MNYKDLKSSDKIRLLSYCYTQKDGSGLMEPGVYKVSDVPEFVLQVGNWRPYKEQGQAPSSEPAKTSTNTKKEEGSK